MIETIDTQAFIDELRAQNKELRRHLEDARKIVVDAVLAQSDASRAVAASESERKRLQHNLDAANMSAAQRIAMLDVDLSDARDEIELNATATRRIVHELLNMLGKKARKRNAERLREIRLQYAGPTP